MLAMCVVFAPVSYTTSSKKYIYVYYYILYIYITISGISVLGIVIINMSNNIINV